MKKRICAVLTAVFLLAGISCALAEQTVFLPESSYRLTLPDKMEYDGPGTGDDDAEFAWVSAELGLENDVVISPTVIPSDEYEKYRTILPYYRNIDREGILVG